MTTGIILVTSSRKKEVAGAIRKVGFKKPTRLGDKYTHSTVDGLALQIIDEKPQVIEFEDITNRFPDNPDALNVLRELNDILPGLSYKPYSYPPKPFSEGTVSDYLKSL